MDEKVDHQSSEDVLTSLVDLGPKNERRGSQRRTSMGEFVVPPGGKPLTSLGDCIPAPSDYTPKPDITKQSTAQYSIAGRYKQPKCPYKAGPADYNTLRDMKWTGRRMTLKGKGTMQIFDIGGDTKNDSVGAAGYVITHNDTGTTGPKYSISYRQREGITNGPPHRLVQPVDTKGYCTPGPNYRPPSGYREGPKKSIGVRLRPNDRVRDGPGPAEYSLYSESQGPAYTLAKRLMPPLKWQQATSNANPAPNEYNLGTMIGKAVAKSVSGRHEPLKQKNFVPASNMYSLHDPILDAPTATLSFRWFEEEEKPYPSPAQYHVTDVCLKKAPAYTMRKKLKLCKQDVDVDNTPGPAHYTVTKKFAENDKAAHSMGKRARSAKNSVPGPNHYRIAVKHRPDGQTAPAFSMARRFDGPNKAPGPGPAAYHPSPPKNYDLSYSMTKRPKSRKKFVTPAANAYKLGLGQTAKGVNTGPQVTLKSRASPFIHSGIGTTARLLEPIGETK